MTSKPGLLFVISGPSGTGKSTVLKRVISRKVKEYYFSVSATTRPPRCGEVDGTHYLFVDRTQFTEMIENDSLLEWAQFAGDYYGTPSDRAERAYGEGKCVLLDIEVQGALQIKERRPDAVLTFLAPPSLDILEERLRSRRTDPDDKITRRLETARLELQKSKLYDYLVVNENLDETVSNIESIIRAEFLRTFRIQNV